MPLLWAGFPGFNVGPVAGFVPGGMGRSGESKLRLSMSRTQRRGGRRGEKPSSAGLCGGHRAAVGRHGAVQGPREAAVRPAGVGGHRIPVGDARRRSEG